MSRGKPVPWTPERIAEAVKRFENGEPVSRISEAMGVGKLSLRRALGLQPNENSPHHKPKPKAPRTNWTVFSGMEDKYVALRLGGKSEGEARDALGVTQGQAERYEVGYRTQTFRRLAYADDGTMPKFARHEEHLAAIKPYVGFDAVSRFMMRRVPA